MRPTIFIASAAALLALSACGGSYSSGTLPDTNTNASQAGDIPAQLDHAVTLAPGQWAAVAGTSLRVNFSGVTSDSRCPSNVQCVWEGDAAVAIKVSLNGQDTPATLHTSGGKGGATETSVGGYTITLADVQPGTVAGQAIAPTAYRVQLVVHQK